jgi:hypothetical protein
MARPPAPDSNLALSELSAIANSLWLPVRRVDRDGLAHHRPHLGWPANVEPRAARVAEADLACQRLRTARWLVVPPREHAGQLRSRRMRRCPGSDRRRSHQAGPDADSFQPPLYWRCVEQFNDPGVVRRQRSHADPEPVEHTVDPVSGVDVVEFR